MDLHFNTRTHEVRDHARAKQRANFIDTRRERSRSTTDIERALDLLGTAAAQHFIPVLAVDMPRVTTRSEQYLAIGAGLTIATASIVSLYLVSQNIHRQDYARRRWRRTQSSMTAGKQQHGGTFGRYGASHALDTAVLRCLVSCALQLPSAYPAQPYPIQPSHVGRSTGGATAIPVASKSYSLVRSRGLFAVDGRLVVCLSMLTSILVDVRDVSDGTPRSRVNKSPDGHRRNFSGQRIDLPLN